MKVYIIPSYFKEIVDRRYIDLPDGRLLLIYTSCVLCTNIDETLDHIFYCNTRQGATMDGHPKMLNGMEG